jgi:hypothetical protein
MASYVDHGDDHFTALQRQQRDALGAFVSAVEEVCDHYIAQSPIAKFDCRADIYPDANAITVKLTFGQKRDEAIRFLQSADSLVQGFRQSLSAVYHAHNNADRTVALYVKASDGTYLMSLS